MVHWESVGALRDLGIYNCKNPMCYWKQCYLIECCAWVNFSGLGGWVHRKSSAALSASVSVCVLSCVPVIWITWCHSFAFEVNKQEEPMEKAFRFSRWCLKTLLGMSCCCGSYWMSMPAVQLHFDSHNCLSKHDVSGKLDLLEVIFLLENLLAV